MIRPQDSLQLALRALGAHRLRSFLTLLGIAVGIAAVILLTSIGEGIHRFVLAEFTQFGTNVISVAPGRTKTAGHSPAGIPTSVRPLTLDDARALERLPHITGMTATVWGNSEVSANGRLRRTTINGVGAQMLKVFAIRVRSGQFLPADEAENARAFVVLGAKLKEELFGSANPLGARVRVGSLQFRVIGVLEAKGQILGFDLDDAAYIPTARALELYNRDGVMKVDLSYEADVPVAAVSARVRQALVARHGREDFTLTTQEDILPRPFACGIRILPRQRPRQVHFAVTCSKVLVVQRLHPCQMTFQRGGERVGQHRHPVLETFPFAHEDLAARKVDILHPQTQTLHDAHAGAVEQPQDQAGGALDEHQQALDFFRRENDRQAFRSLRRFNVIQPRQLGYQYLLVEEEQGALRLVLSRCRNTPRDGKVSEKRLDLVRPHFTRVPLVVKEDETSHPAAIGLLRA